MCYLDTRITGSVVFEQQCVNNLKDFRAYYSKLAISSWVEFPYLRNAAILLWLCLITDQSLPYFDLDDK